MQSYNNYKSLCRIMYICIILWKTTCILSSIFTIIIIYFVPVVRLVKVFLVETEGDCTIECSKLGITEIEILLVVTIVPIMTEIEMLLVVDTVLIMGESCSTVLGNIMVVGSLPIIVTYKRVVLKL